MAAVALRMKPQLGVKLSNRKASFTCDPDEWPRVKEFFQFCKPGVEFSRLVREGAWDGVTNMCRNGSVGAGLFLAERAAMEAAYDLRVEDVRTSPKFKRPDGAESDGGVSPLNDGDSPLVEGGRGHGLPSAKLRPYQARAVRAMIAHSGTGGIILVATGAGKTRLAADYCARIQGAVVFVVDELTLLEQSRREIERHVGEGVGVVGRSEFTPRRITVATVQTLHKRRAKPEMRRWFATIDAVIIDEIHVQLNRRNADVLTLMKPKACFGLTATLEEDKPWVMMPAMALTGPVIFRYDIKQGVKEGFLSKGRIIRVAFHDPLRGPSPGYWTEDKGEKIFIPADSPAAEYRHRVVLSKPRNDCVEALIREAVGRGRRVVALFERKLHLRVMSRRLSDVNHRAISGDDATDVRFSAMREMDDGDLPLILASRVFGRGVDVAAVDVIIDATALPGRNGAIQRYGRAARKAEGKGGLVYLDVSDKGNRFAGAAKIRARALAETGSPVTTVEWRPGTRVF